MDDVLTELRLLAETADSIGATVRRSIENTKRETAALSQRIDDLNSELIAQSNRIQALTVHVTTAPAEVAGKIVRLRDADA